MDNNWKKGDVFIDNIGQVMRFLEIEDSKRAYCVYVQLIDDNNLDGWAGSFLIGETKDRFSVSKKYLSSCRKINGYGTPLYKAINS